MIIPLLFLDSVNDGIYVKLTTDWRTVALFVIVITLIIYLIRWKRLK